LNYEVNKDYISKVLCENKEKKELHCEGKCHLKKELQKEEKKESTPTGSSKEKFEITLFHSFQEQEIVFETTLLAYQFPYTFLLSDKHLVPVFHPPGLNA
jgi:hypothetical protein